MNRFIYDCKATAESRRYRQEVLDNSEALKSARRIDSTNSPTPVLNISPLYWALIQLLSGTNETTAFSFLLRNNNKSNCAEKPPPAAKITENAPETSQNYPQTVTTTLATRGWHVASKLLQSFHLLLQFPQQIWSQKKGVLNNLFNKGCTGSLHQVVVRMMLHESTAQLKFILRQVHTCRSFNKTR